MFKVVVVIMVMVIMRMIEIMTVLVVDLGESRGLIVLMAHGRFVATKTNKGRWK